jgi:hypothetical protein
MIYKANHQINQEAGHLEYEYICFMLKNIFKLFFL